MNDELLKAAKEFDEHFIRKFPDVEHPVKLISDFNSVLNGYAQQSNEHGDTIHFITVLLSRTELEEFAVRNSPADHGVNAEPGNATEGDDELATLEEQAERQDQEMVAGTDKVVYGDEDEGGLKELVGKLINDLESDS